MAVPLGKNHEIIILYQFLLYKFFNFGCCCFIFTHQKVPKGVHSSSGEILQGAGGLWRGQGIFWTKTDYFDGKNDSKRCRILTPTANVGNGKCWQFSRSGRKRSHNFKSNSFGDLYRKTREIGCFLKNALGWWEIFREFFSRFFGYHQKPLVEDPSALNNEDQGATEV